MGDDALTRLNGVDVAPDGLAERDAEGAIWVADATHHRALRVGEGGEVIGEVAVDDGQVYDVTLGGADGRTLFLAVSPSYLKSERADTRDSALLSRRVEVALSGFSESWSRGEMNADENVRPDPSAERRLVALLGRHADRRSVGATQ